MKVEELIGMLEGLDNDSTVILSEIIQEDKVGDFTITEQRTCQSDGANLHLNEKLVFIHNIHRGQ